ncbi:MAG: hypothetical protein HYZ75_12925 [Elusimicrobia bacterium]|nr:hypothetical protein [Elusimicrobiota bacterium]
MAGLRGEVRAVAGTDESLRRSLHELFIRHYDNVSWEVFSADFAEKDFVILLRRAADGAAAGFSTQKVLRGERGGDEARILFSGDTVIDKAAWGEQELVKAWCRLAGAVKSQEPNSPLHWLLICKGYRTYLYLPLFFDEYWPRREAPTPPEEQALIDDFGRWKFGPAYKDGLLRFAAPKGNLTPELAAVPSGRREDPRVKFFLERNPGYAAGDELVCLTEVSDGNMKGLAKRLYRDGYATGLHGLLTG